MSGDEPGRPLEGLRVLVVEDMLHVAWELCDQLEEAGATITGPVGRLQNALDLAEREELDAAVLDLSLAGESAAPVAAVLRRRSVPFILVSGYAIGDVPQEMFGATLLTKPVAFQSLVRALRGLGRPA